MNYHSQHIRIILRVQVKYIYIFFISQGSVGPAGPPGPTGNIGPPVRTSSLMLLSRDNDNYAEG